MLKVFLGFVVSVVVLLSSAYVLVINPRTYAASANVLLTQIQAGSIGAAAQEFIVIYNNSPHEVNISGWCLTNKTSSVITCLNPPIVGQAIYLPPFRHALIASTALAITLPIGSVTTTYAPTNQSSGSITGSSDTISLIDKSGTIIDRQTWTTSIAAGMQFERSGSGAPKLYQDTDSAADWTITLPGPLPTDETEIDTMVVDVCPNIDGIQTVLPVGKEMSQAGDCVARTIMQVNITEVLPNAVGSDEGKEFIELFNPNTVVVNLADYRLYVGPHYENSYNFPAGSTIQPGSYRSFSNAEIPFSLLNSSSLVRVTLSDGTVVNDMPAYVDPKEGQSWADVNDEWMYTNQPTPSLSNLAMDDTMIESELGISLQLCAENQYRSPETNRCRLITPTTSSMLSSCKDGQYRSEETNRCRNITATTKTVTPCKDDEERNQETHRCRKITTSSQPSPCKEGQERNPDTNRCRTITKMPSADYGVLGAETKSESSGYVWVAVGGLLLVAMGYAIWEWHYEIRKFIKAGAVTVRRFVRIRK